MKSRVRTLRVGAAALAIGALASSAMVLGGATSAVAAPAKATTTTVNAAALSPQICIYGCL
jgi:hypothetical protein